MTHRPIPHPTKAQINAMTVDELNVYLRNLRNLRQEISWRSGPALEAVSKRLEVAEKIRDLQVGREMAGDV